MALIIGQSNYEHLPLLSNPANDACQMDDMLRALGFEITVAIDLGGRKLARALSNFTEDAEGADVAVIYYSGHGIEAGGENWLLPVDVDVAALNQAEHQLLHARTQCGGLGRHRIQPCGRSCRVRFCHRRSSAAARGHCHLSRGTGGGGRPRHWTGQQYKSTWVLLFTMLR